MNSKKKVLGGTLSNVKDSSDSKSDAGKFRRVQQEREQHSQPELPWSGSYVPELPQYPHLQALTKMDVMGTLLPYGTRLEFPQLLEVTEDCAPDPQTVSWEPLPEMGQYFEPANPPQLREAGPECYQELCLSLPEDNEGY